MRIKNPQLFKQLITEAWSQPFEGWDFSFISSRRQESSLPWNYFQKARAAMSTSDTFLDMGTGGGETLASLQPLPSHAYATEAYVPNISVAQARLQPLGVRVIAIESASNLPFDSAFFDTIINRHSKYIASEVARILQVGGRFLTQQVGEQNSIELNRWLENQSPPERPSSLQKALAYLEQAGMIIDDQSEAFPETIFSDVGAVVYYLRAIPWQVEGFTVEKYHNQLATIHNHIQAHGKLVVQDHRYYINAHK